MTSFTPISALAGGLLIGAAAVVLFAANGRIAGISGIVDGALHERDGRAWRVAFLAGLLIGAGFAAFLGVASAASGSARAGTLIVAGLLVGIGTSIGSGCTSGHGVCGIARLSPRSIIATLAFMAAGMLTVYGARHVLG